MLQLETLTTLLFCLLSTLTTASPASTYPPGYQPIPSPPPCRFSPRYSQKQILRDPSKYIWDMLYWEGQFHQDGIGYNVTNGMTYDGTLIDPVTGVATAKHPFSAASKESLHIMLLTHALNSSPLAARFLSPSNPTQAPSIAFSILLKKLATYLQFNNSLPGYGGFLPWYIQGGAELAPTWDWGNRVPALDNGELVWAVYGAVEVLSCSSDATWRALGEQWQVWLDYTKITAAKVFYNGTGQVCDVTRIGDDTMGVWAPGQTYVCESAGRINDPFEGELFTWWLYFFGGLSKEDRKALWVYKRPQLRNVEYCEGGVGPITVQQGYWFSAHETWKVLEMPYYDIDLVRRLFLNAERVRTCNSVVNGYDGMFASVNNITDSNGEIVGYISDAGIPSISNQTTFELDVVTPYSVFSTMLFNQSVALAWWKNMVDGGRMQNPYGSTESIQRSGLAVSSFVSWDSKITTINALLGGVSGFVRDKMKRDGVYDDFIRITKREYGMKFKANQLKGEDIELCMPKKKVPKSGISVYTECTP